MDSCYINERWCLRNWWSNFSLVWRKQIRKKFHWLKLYFFLPKPASSEKYWTLRWNISTGCFMLHNTRSYQKKRNPSKTDCLWSSAEIRRGSMAILNKGAQSHNACWWRARTHTHTLAHSVDESQRQVWALILCTTSIYIMHHALCHRYLTMCL